MIDATGSNSTHVTDMSFTTTPPLPPMYPKIYRYDHNFDSFAPELVLTLVYFWEVSSYTVAGTSRCTRVNKRQLRDSVGNL